MNIVEDDEGKRERNLEDEEDRDKESIAVVMRRYTPFIKKIFNRYSNLKGAKKDIT